MANGSNVAVWIPPGPSQSFRFNPSSILCGLNCHLHLGHPGRTEWLASHHLLTLVRPVHTWKIFAEDYGFNNFSHISTPELDMGVSATFAIAFWLHTYNAFLVFTPLLPRILPTFFPLFFVLLSPCFYTSWTDFSSLRVERRRFFQLRSLILLASLGPGSNNMAYSAFSPPVGEFHSGGQEGSWCPPINSASGFSFPSKLFH